MILCKAGDMQGEGIMRSLLIIAMLTTTASAEQKTFTGKQLLAYCTSESASIEDISCGFYITGFVHGLASAKEELVCLPKGGISGEEGRAIFVRMMRTTFKEYPIDVEVNAALVASLALQFPCKK
jgi:Ssp1 endopeptidase immunity protein Rap1a